MLYNLPLHLPPYPLPLLPVVWFLWTLSTMFTYFADWNRWVLGADLRAGTKSERQRYFHRAVIELHRAWPVTLRE